MSKVPTKTQVSAGGVAFRKRRKKIEVAIIRAAGGDRWQLPKGLVGKDETTEAAAVREVREEAGVETEMVGLIDKVEYWYFSNSRNGRVRFHKYVYFYLLHYLSGDVADHDREVDEARWVEIDEAMDMLAFANEKNIVRRAKEMIEA
jgi:8-oxo-dGTP pyrophosphatase MutT (NUDIX family)